LFVEPQNEQTFVQVLWIFRQFWRTMRDKKPPW